MRARRAARGREVMRPHPLPKHTPIIRIKRQTRSIKECIGGTSAAQHYCERLNSKG